MAEEKPAARAEEPDAEGNVRIEVLVGPYRGKILKVTEAHGAAAIAERWARPPKIGSIAGDEPLPEPYTAEELEEAIQLSQQAAPVLRNEPDAPAWPSGATGATGASVSAAKTTKDMQAAPAPSGYKKK